METVQKANSAKNKMGYGSECGHFSKNIQPHPPPKVRGVCLALFSTLPSTVGEQSIIAHLTSRRCKGSLKKKSGHMSKLSLPYVCTTLAWAKKSLD